MVSQSGFGGNVETTHSEDGLQHVGAPEGVILADSMKWSPFQGPSSIASALESQPQHLKLPTLHLGEVVSEATRR